MPTAWYTISNALIQAMAATNATSSERRNQATITSVATKASTVLSLIAPTNGKTSQMPVICDCPSLSEHPQKWVGGDLEHPRGGAEVQPVELVLDGALEDRSAQLAL